MATDGLARGVGGVMQRLASFVTRRWQLVVVAWLVAAAVSVAVVPSFTEVATFDDNAFLPADSSAVRGQRLVEESWPQDNFTRSAVVALVRADAPLTEADLEWTRAVVGWIDSPEGPDHVGHVTTHLRDPDLTDSLTSDDGHALLVVVGLEVPPFSPMAGELVEDLRHEFAVHPPPAGAEVYVTGAAGLAVDEDEAIEASVRRTERLTVVLVVILILWVLRSPVAALVPLVTVGAAYTVSLAVVGLLAQAGMDVSYLFQMFAIVIVFGAGTDYSLLAMARYREELAAEDARAGGAATAQPDRSPQTLTRTLTATMVVLGGVLASTAASTIVGFSAQVVAQFGLFRTMGPALAIAVAITLVAGVTLTPAVMRGFGRWLFWPGDGLARPAAPVPPGGEPGGEPGDESGGQSGADAAPARAGAPE